MKLKTAEATQLFTDWMTNRMSYMKLKCVGTWDKFDGWKDEEGYKKAEKEFQKKFKSANM